MNGHKRSLLALVALVLCGAFAVSAQSSGILTLGTPAVSQITTAGQTFSYDYSLSEPRQITLQALGDSAQPTITILRNGEVVAQQPNDTGALTVSLSTLLNAGSYVVQVGARNNATGLIVLVLQSETAVTSSTLTPGSPLNGVVSAGAPLALYSFNALSEPAYLYIDSSLPTSGVTARLINSGDGAVNGQVDATVIGARFRIPGGSAAYQVEVESSGAGSDQPFTICLAAVSTGGCEAGGITPPLATEQVVVIQPTVDAYCTVSASANNPVNIRQSASTAAIIVASLPVGARADVIGISPDGSFYNVLYSGSNGWVALGVVTTSGNCVDILTITPPSVIAPPQQPAAPTLPPPLPTVPPLPTPFGPCLITITSPTYVYQSPNADISNLQDQVQVGELIPTGRLADNSWWKTNYGGAWVQTSTFGVSTQVSGDCRNLPIVSP
ncbi:MAG: SH3 domain-containing protein [Chloroflexota bacterium]